ncbi:MAG TPA: glutathione binding-like protein [Polyangiaceae bacterium]|jgi:glutathione S-transferase|nr:MAG: Glutathione S-transferase GST-4.5 [Deltaproteobacteria bacterium ADurb.Bin207]HNS96574.1 glutathione binding-like protein [Polyangiaceae bacterium]HNZ24807.1 glutathione binding-like protein [Polyangiaceae bacterium]HOD22023.1 glutathione binding-like protein [Polyangiaceae bacterium]HOE47989.1 glutathione binding-like protein [Polyangiaceae bacterium]
MMKLYYMPGACSLASRIVLEWTGASWVNEKVGHEQLHQEAYLRINPMGAVPALQVDDTIITQNSGILTYLAEAFPKARLGGGETPLGKAEVHRWLGFINSDIHPTFKPFFGSTSFLGDDTMIEKTRTEARRLLRNMFEIIDRQLKGRDWIAGERSIADAYLFVVLGWTKGVGVDLSGFDQITRFVERMNQDPGVQRALQFEKQA